MSRSSHARKGPKARPDVFKGLNRNAQFTISLPAGDPQLDAPYDGPLIKNVRYLGSYDIVEQDLIIVPGSPRIWRPPSAPFTLYPGKAKTNRHQRIKPTDLALELLFTAVDVMATPLSWPDVDIISNRRALRLLFKWIHGGRDEFRIDLQPLGERTLLLCEEKVDFSWQNPGYGVAFENKATRPMPGTERGLEHARIVHYDFLGLNVVLRYEADARVGAAQSAPGLSPSIPNTLPFVPNAHSPRVIRAGEYVAQEDIVEVKSVTGNGVVTCPISKITDATPQLVLSATQRLHTGLHTKGEFYKLEERLCDERTLLDSRPRVVASMRRLHRVLGDLKNAVRQEGVPRRLTIVHRVGESTLGLYERTSTDDLLLSVYQERFTQAPST